mmetsp:Transcript_24844/g.28367  ORF Transcript_24844/g.28367 Transcript_24844/m.28367 type:complete len:587 (-) Transcript_24844:119-1879(-)
MDDHSIISYSTVQNILQQQHSVRVFFFKMSSSTAAVSGAPFSGATLSSSSSSTGQPQPQPQPLQEPQQRKDKGKGKQRRTTTVVGTISVYVLMACSALLLIRSSQLQSYRFKAALLKNNNNVGSKQKTRRVVVPVAGNQYYAPSLDYRIGAGISQYMNNPDNGTTFKEAHVYCDDGLEKDVLWEWWQPPRSPRSRSPVSRSLSSSGLRKKKKNKHKNKKNQNKKKDEDDNQKPKPKRSTRKRLLIGVSGGYDNSAKLLKQAVWSARVYGTIWDDVTVVTVQGTSFSPHGCKVVSSKYSTISKIQLLLTAIELRSEGGNESYDRLLLLDADTMIYDMDIDVTTLTILPTTTTSSTSSTEKGGRGNDDNNNNTNDNNFIVAGGPPIIATKDGTTKKEQNTTQLLDPWKNLDSSMLLWNLEHPDTPAIAREWYHLAQQAIIRGTYRNDQKYLHISLQKYCEHHQHNHNNDIKDENNNNYRESCSAVRTLEHQEFSDETQGTIIQQFLSTATSTTTAPVPSTPTMPTDTSNNNNRTPTVSSSSSSQSSTQLPSPSRLARMEETAQRICLRYPHACQEMGTQPSPHYETTS